MKFQQIHRSHTSKIYGLERKFLRQCLQGGLGLGSTFFTPVQTFPLANHDYFPSVLSSSDMCPSIGSSNNHSKGML